MINEITKLIYKNNKKIKSDFEFSRYTFDIELLNEIVNKFDFEKNVKIFVPDTPYVEYINNGKQYNKYVSSERVRKIKLNDGFDVVSETISSHINNRINNLAKENDEIIFLPYQLPFLCKLPPPVEDYVGIIIRYGYIEINKNDTRIS